MSNLQYNIVERDGMVNVTVVLDGSLLSADEQHPQITQILAQVRAGNAEGLADLFDLSPKAAALFADVSADVKVENSRVYVNGEEVEGGYADQIVRFLEEGLEEENESLANFLSKCYTHNTTPDVRENLSRWLAAEQFTILPNGNILGYRGLNADYTSKHAGPGIVNGVRVNGHLDNSVGNVVSIDSHLVENDPSNGCASGLHVGTYAYARDWAGHGGVVVSVEVDPADVRSVPYECGSSKMRVSKYTVLDTITQKVESAVSHDYDDSEYDEYDEDYPNDDFLDGYDQGYDDGTSGNAYRY